MGLPVLQSPVICWMDGPIDGADGTRHIRVLMRLGDEINCVEVRVGRDNKVDLRRDILPAISTLANSFSNPNVATSK